MGDPADPRRFACELVYPYCGERSDGVLVRSQMLEDKWDVLLWDDSLYLVRSWTGALWHRVHLEFGPGRVALREIITTAAAAMDDESLPPREVDFLLRTLLYQQLLPHPLPGGFPDAPRAIAQHSFSRYGRYAYFATYEEMRGRPALP